MDLIPSSNPAAVNLDQTESEIESHVAGAGSDKKETLTLPRKVRRFNNRIYRDTHYKASVKRSGILGSGSTG
jgi:hypothetical protein